MDRLRQKGKKDKSFMSDVKNIKEISKIKEILRTVKMNSSMRLRAPPGSKVMDSKDFNDNEDLFEESATSVDQSEIEMPSATNPNVVFHDSSIELSNENKNDIDIVNAKQSASTSQVKNEITEVENTKALESQIQSDQRVTNESETQNEDIFLKKPLGHQDDQQSTKDFEKESVEQIIRELIDLSEGNAEDLSNVDLETRSSSSIVNLSQEPSEPDTTCNQVNVLLGSQPTGQYENQLEDITQELPAVKPEKESENIINKVHLEQDSDFSHSSEHHKNEPKESTEEAPTEKLEQVEKSTQEENQHFIEEQSNQISQEIQLAEQPGVSLESNNDVVVIVESLDVQHATEIPKITTRSRKLSLDHSLLSAREGLSQSEVDLNTIGKSPLERKSSFFRKKMDSFFRNTTELFKKQSFNSKPQPIQRRGSMSVSLQSLNERSSDLNSDFTAALLKTQQEEIPSSMTSLSSASTLGRSASSVSMCHSEVLNPRQGSEQSLVGSQPTLHVTHALGGYPSNSVHSLNESYLHDTLLQNRAISMSSGLDSQSWLRRKKSTSSNRSNRVTWVASEGVTNYFRRMIQNENSKNIQEDQTYQDARIPENKAYTKTESKGRRLSYQRAVSGEDPVLPSRYHDSSFRRRTLPDHSEENPEISAQLAVYTNRGVPALRGFEIAIISDAALKTLVWAQNTKNVEQFIGTEVTGKQTVICELITTEADYINHLQIIVNMFLSSAHSLQDEGKMLDVDSSQLFLNLPDILNANRIFWELTFHPMISRALEKGVPFEVMLMEPGFLSLPEIFAPYEKYALSQQRANEYLRSLSGNVDFTTYLAWCHSLKGCQRLQITDLLVKPIQRVTKYGLLLKRIAQFTDTENELNSVNLMEQTVKTFVAELNRGVKQRQELEKAEYYAGSVENFELDSLQAFFQEFKDEEMDDYYYRMFTQSNLRAPMLNCHSQHARTVIHVGDLRFKDGNKEIEVRAILFTDMLIVCKKQSKGSPYQYKMIRPKYMIDKLVAFPKYGVRNNNMEMTFIFVVMVDDFGSCYTCFTLTESSKDPNGSETLKLWEQKIKEAQYTYNLAVWLYHNPSYNISDLDVDLASDHGNSSVKQKQQSYEEYNIEREAKERVATMLFRTTSPSISVDYSQSHVCTSCENVNVNVAGQENVTIPISRKVPGIDVLRNRWKRPSTSYSSRNSRYSSFQKSTSAASNDESQPGYNKHIYGTGGSVDQTSLHVDDGCSSVTVNVMKESESEQETETNTNQMRTMARSPGASKTLHVQNPVVALIHSLPDLSLVVPPRRQIQRSPSPVSASEKLYQIHQESLKSRLAAQTQYLSPDTRGTSYPPLSPTRASLKRGLAFSQSFQKPGLTKMGHVASSSALDQIDTAPTPSPVKSEKASFVAKLLPGTSSDKQEKEKEKEKEKKQKQGRKDKSNKDRKSQK